MLKWIAELGNLGKILLAIIVVIVVMGSMTWTAFGRLKDITDETTRSTLVVATMKTLLINMLDAETGQRGFVLTGESTYLNPFTVGSSQAEETYGDLQSLSEDSEKPAIAELGKQMRIKLDELRVTIRLRNEKGFEAADAVVLTDTGKNAMDVIRSIVARFSADRLTKIDNQRAAIESLRQIIEVAFLLSLALTTTLLALTIAVIFTER